MVEIELEQPERSSTKMDNFSNRTNPTYQTRIPIPPATDRDNNNRRRNDNVSTGYKPEGKF